MPNKKRRRTSRADVPPQSDDDVLPITPLSEEKRALDEWWTKDPRASAAETYRTVAAMEFSPEHFNVARKQLAELRAKVRQRLSGACDHPKTERGEPIEGFDGLGRMDLLAFDSEIERAFEAIATEEREPGRLHDHVAIGRRLDARIAEARVWSHSEVFVPADLHFTKEQWVRYNESDSHFWELLELRHARDMHFRPGRRRGAVDALGKQLLSILGGDRKKRGREVKNELQKCVGNGVILSTTDDGVEWRPRAGAAPKFVKWTTVLERRLPDLRKLVKENKPGIPTV